MATFINNYPIARRIFHSVFSICFITICFQHSVRAQNYSLLYENNFEQQNALDGFEYTDVDAWRISGEEGSRALELYGKSRYVPAVRSPLNIAVIKDLMVGSFVLELDMKQTGREYGHRDMCVFFNMKDPSNFYYVHLASVADPNAHNIFLVNDEPRRNIALKTTEGVAWGDDWNKVRIERNAESGTIKVFFNDMEAPVMEAEDQHFREGLIGFGSFDDTGMIDNIRIWGERILPREGFFK